MPVATPKLHNYTIDDPSSYKAALDGNAKVNSMIAGAFAPHEMPTPAMTVLVDGGMIQVGDTIITKSQTGLAFAAPATNPRYDRVYIDRDGNWGFATGVEAASPTKPALSSDKFPLFAVYLTPGMTAITNSAITDERPLIRTNNVAPPQVAGYASGVTEYLEGDVGASSTAFDVAANIGASWESVGPTGSGATNIWTALDSLPAGTKWITLKTQVEVYDATGNQVDCTICARKTGSVAGVSARTTIYKAFFRDDALAVRPRMVVVTTNEVPLDSSRRFDLCLILGSGDATGISSMYLTKFAV